MRLKIEGEFPDAARLREIAMMLSGATIHVDGAAIWQRNAQGGREIVGTFDYTYQNPEFEDGESK